MTSQQLHRQGQLRFRSKCLTNSRSSSRYVSLLSGPLLQLYSDSGSRLTLVLLVPLSIGMQAQLRDLEAIQQLQREKERAERRARQLEEQFRSSKRSSVSSNLSSAVKHRSSTLVIDEPLTSDDDDEVRNNRSGLDLDGLGDDDLGDESLPPPQYDDDGASAPLVRAMRLSEWGSLALESQTI